MDGVNAENTQLSGLRQVGSFNKLNHSFIILINVRCESCALTVWYTDTWNSLCAGEHNLHSFQLGKFFSSVLSSLMWFFFLIRLSKYAGEENKLNSLMTFAIFRYWTNYSILFEFGEFMHSERIRITSEALKKRSKIRFVLTFFSRLRFYNYNCLISVCRWSRAPLECVR